MKVHFYYFYHAIRVVYKMIKFTVFTLYIQLSRDFFLFDISQAMESKVLK
jgi:hypothetical protein